MFKSGQIMKHLLTDFHVFVSLWLLTVAAINSSKPSSPTTIREKVTMPCPALQEVVRNDGTFDIVYWSVCTSERCDHKDTKWDWVAGMNNKGITQVGPERVNITTDGALEIHKVNLSDTGQYMCTVKTINHSSPGIYHTTLIVIEAANQWDKRNPKPDTKDCEKDYSDDSRNLIYILVITICVVSVLLVIAVGYIVYIKRNDLRCLNQGSSPA
ncbi:uncharacterized protein LOC110041055 isoform X2 [Orbicella faveolata]|uniref:uncharacterized protein LOC110041055 isoform X2 n=1 Tax=Orbicella faveolata TaxID=48498 RepID=UPI0009E44D28|nr:uncharacterized protein LOC110041055 isoform X2 [Orbicella faveolata]